VSSEEQGLLVEISRKLDVLVGLTAAAGKETGAQINILTSLGYGPSFIASIVGLAPNAVTLRISRKRTASKRIRRGGN